MKRKLSTPVLVNLFLEAIAPTVAASSLHRITHCLLSMRKSLAGESPTTERLSHWIRRRLSVDRVSPATLALERTYANRFLTWCVDNEYMERNPFKGIPRIPIKIVEKAEVSDTEYMRLLRTTEGSWWPPLLKVVYHTGARAVDVCNLRWDNISWVHGEYTSNCKLSFVPRKTQHSGRVVAITLPDGPSLDLEILHDMSTRDLIFVFPEAQRLHARQDGSFQRAFTGVLKKAGLESRNLTFHCFRRTRARRMLTGPNRVTPLVAADVLGISNLNTLRRYSPASDEEKARAVNL